MSTACTPRSARVVMSVSVCPGVDIQVEFGLDPEDLVDLVEHGPVLRGHGDQRREERRLIEALMSGATFTASGRVP